MSEQDEVRTFAEACGWTYESSEWDGFQYTGAVWLSADKKYSFAALPDFLHDLNACVEALEWFCGHEHFMWQLEMTPIGGYACHLRATPKRIGLLACDEAGDTKQEAIIRAVNAAARSGK